jgi:hypothetical protein
MLTEIIKYILRMYVFRIYRTSVAQIASKNR